MMHAPTLRLPTFAVPLLLALAVLGYLTGTRHVSGSGSTPQPPAMRAALGTSVGVEYPLGWNEAATGPAIPGLTLKGLLRLQAGPGGSEAGLEAGTVAGTAPSPLPPGIRARLRNIPRAEVVSLVALQAIRYPDVRLTGYRQRLELYAIPGQANGEAILACHAPASEVTVLEQCERIVSSVSLAGQSTSDVTPDGAYGRRLAGIVAGVERARRAARARMSRSGAVQSLAASSASLAARFLHGAGSLGNLDAPPVAGAAQVALARAMIAAGGAYGALGQAARKRSPGRYQAARLRVQRAERSVDRALENFALLGYAAGSQL